MYFIELEANVESQENPIDFPEEIEELTNGEMEDFIDDSEQPQENISFY